MEKLPSNCCVCLETPSNLQQITERDSENQTAASKLRQCVSEIDWKDDYLICTACLSNLRLVCEFIEKCLSAELVRNKSPTPIIEDDVEEPPTPPRPLRFACASCDFKSTTKKQLTKHSAKEHEAIVDKPYQCELCSKQYSYSCHLVEHLKYHDKKRSEVCPSCGKTFITKNDLRIHEKTHANKREYSCGACDKTFNTHNDLRIHKLVVHTDPSEWQHVCDLCKKRFPIKSNFDAHIRRHKNERPFSCHVCNKRFIDKCVLVKHLKSHSNFKPFVCKICAREYKDKWVMLRHMARVHGVGGAKVTEVEKKHFCHVCPKAFGDRHKLGRHLRTHTGEKPFLCDMCSKKFSDKSYLTQHVKKAHGSGNNCDD